MAALTKVRAADEERLAGLQKDRQSEAAGLTEKQTRVADLKARRGDIYRQIKAASAKLYDTSALRDVWLSELIALLQKAEGETVRADVDGKFRFENVRDESPILFALVTYRSDQLFWIQKVNPESKSAHDLADYNGGLFDVLAFEAIRQGVAAQLR